MGNFKRLNHTGLRVYQGSPNPSSEQVIKLGGFNPDAIMKSFANKQISSPFHMSQSKSIKSSKPRISDFFKREDMYDQLISNKTELN